MDLFNHVKDLYSNGTSFLSPLLRNLTSNLMLGSVALQTLLGNPITSTTYRSAKPTNSLDSFIEWERPIALQNIMCHIGSLYLNEPSISPGVVVASPSKTDPDYFYTWTRDAALTFEGLVEIFVRDENQGVQQKIHEYILSQMRLQGVDNPAGSLRDGSGLGEAKFTVDLRAFTENWGRPQRDGPALRAIAMISYSKWLLKNGYRTETQEKVWPLVQNDLGYVAQYWNDTGFDLWEEVEGSSFFTTISQYRALVEGSNMAKELGLSCPHCDAIAPHILCFLQAFWSEKDGHILSNIHARENRSGKDANSLLASIHAFSPQLRCSSLTFQPCSAAALANHKAVVDSFRPIYPVNAHLPPGEAAAVGRYPEDVYYGGHPWYLTTLAAAEQLYDALIVWKEQGYIEVNDISLPFMQDFIPTIGSGVHNKTEPIYNQLLRQISSYADGFMDIVAKYTHPNGSLAEQFHRETGEPLSARDLTWSYAAFLSAAARREGKIADSWMGELSTPEACLATSIVGSYSSVTLSSFPLPSTTNVAPPVTTQCRDRYVVVSFEELVETQWDERVKMVGSSWRLGQWNPGNGVELCANEYTAERPTWKVEMVLGSGEEVRYKFVKITVIGEVEWEGGGDRTYTVPKCTGTAFVEGRWLAG